MLWALSLAASLAIGLLLQQLYTQSSTAESGRAAAALSQACDAILDRYGYFTSGWAGPAPGAPDGGIDPALRRDLAAVVASALAPFGNIEGGLWQAQAGLLPAAPADPAAPAATAASPAPWQAEIIALASAASQDEAARRQAIASGATTVLLRACPLSGPIPGLVGWVLTRIAAAPGYSALRLGFAVLFALMLSSSLWLTIMLVTYARRIRAIERALAVAPDAVLPPVPLTGERDLDRIVAALNRAGQSLAQARARSEALTAQVAASERLAALGRVAAGVAHEIRNPIAAMRLRAENALAGNRAADPARATAALQAILGQVARLDRLIAELLEMTRAREPAPAATNLAALLREAAAEQPCESRITVESPESWVLLDSVLLRRALDNLLQNALRHAPPDRTVLLRATLEAGRLAIEVIDHGPGVPEALRAHLFEPFVTGHAEGTGLGLAIAREMTEAQGGRLTLANPAHPTVFRIELPAPPSEPPACPAS